MKTFEMPDVECIEIGVMDTLTADGPSGDITNDVRPDGW